MADTSTKPIDLSFLARDVQSQIENSKNVLKQAQALRDLLPKIEDPEIRRRVEETINQLLGITSSISANVATTTSSASVTISTAFIPMKKS